jgi:hypothetical protein
MSITSETSETSENEIQEYYLLVSETDGTWFRIHTYDFEPMFELVKDTKDTYQFNRHAKELENNYWNLDTYMQEHWFSHARSSWRTGCKPFIVKEIYYWHNNIYH